MKANALFPIMEGIVSTLGKGGNPYAQSLTPWLRGMKETINLAARFVENDFVFYVSAGLTDTEVAVTADGAKWVYGLLLKSVETVAHSVYTLDKAAATAYVPGTTAEGATVYHGPIFYAPIAAATTPVVMGQAFFPYHYFALGVSAVSVDVSDQATGSTASTVNLYTFARNQ